MIYSTKVFGSVLVSIAMANAAVPVVKTPPLPVPVVSTFAGGAGASGLSNGVGTRASFSNPNGVSISPDLKYALVADNLANQIRKIIRSTAEVTLFAGNVNGDFGTEDGFGTRAHFGHPTSIDISPDGTYALIVDYETALIRKLVIATGRVTTFVGGTHGYVDAIGTNAQFDYPNSIDISPNGLYALVTEHDHATVRKIDISTRSVTTLAGATYGEFDSYPRFDNGVGTNAYFAYPAGVAISPDSTYALVSERDNHSIRKIDISTQQVSFVAGDSGNFGYADGFGANVKFGQLSEIEIYPDGSYALIADSSNCNIRKLNLGTGEVTTFVGHCGALPVDGPGTIASFYYPRDVTISPTGRSALVIDVDAASVRKIQILPPPRAPPARLR